MYAFLCRRFVYLLFALCYNKIDFKIADKPEITSHPKSVDIKEGGNVTFSCNYTANPSPTTSWTKDESPITNDSRISYSVVNKVLTIMNVNRKDSGEYRCVASNKLGNDTSEAAELNVKCEFIALSFKISIRNRTEHFNTQSLFRSKHLKITSTGKSIF